MVEKSSNLDRDSRKKQKYLLIKNLLNLVKKNKEENKKIEFIFLILDKKAIRAINTLVEKPSDPIEC